MGQSATKGQKVVYLLPCMTAAAAGSATGPPSTEGSARLGRASRKSDLLVQDTFKDCEAWEDKLSAPPKLNSHFTESCALSMIGTVQDLVAKFARKETHGAATGPPAALKTCGTCCPVFKNRVAAAVQIYRQ